jgi:hypothetical protein
MLIPNGSEIIGVASMFGFVCMLFVFTAQLVELVKAARPRLRVIHPWELQSPSRATGFAASRP